MHICLCDCMNSIMCIAAAAMKFAPRRVARTERANERREEEREGDGAEGRRQFRFAPHCTSALPAPLCIVILISGKSGDGFEADVVRERVQYRRGGVQINVSR